MVAAGRSYGGAEDLAAMQAALEAWRAVDPCGQLHPGDVPHRIYNGLREFDPAGLVRLWDGGGGDLAAFALVYPHWKAFDVMYRPGDLVAAEAAEVATDWCETVVQRRAEQPVERVGTDVWDCDDERRAMVAARGYEHRKDQFALTQQDIGDVPPPALPAGFVIRPAAGPEEADRLAEVHASAFESDWPVGEYRRLMGTPGYDPGRELVAVAPDGRFAAFTIIWLDHTNRYGLFEPVGTHEDFRRLGLGRAMLAEGMRRMRAAGMRTATVLHEMDNDGSAALYAAAGFTRRHVIADYAKAF